MARIDHQGTEISIAQLRPCAPESAACELTRHMDECVAIAVRLGVCEGAALAAHASVIDHHGDDLAAADRALVDALRQIVLVQAAETRSPAVAGVTRRCPPPNGDGEDGVSRHDQPALGVQS